MFIFGHMGIGSELVKPWARGLVLRWVLLGTLLPDLIDKPLYYGMVLLTHHHGAEIGLISGTRTFGHSAVFLLLIVLAAWLRNSRTLAAVSLGVASHLVLDNLGDTFIASQMHTTPTTVWALLFPLMGWRFPVMPFQTVKEHFEFQFNQVYLGAEVVGALLLGWTYWKLEHRQEILSSFRERVAKRTSKFRRIRIRKSRR